MLIGLAGFSRVGKDALCKELGWYRVAFADALKKFCQPLFDEIGIDQFDAAQKEIARPVLVAVGKAARQIDTNFWIDRVYLPIGVNVCVTDVRYVNEVKLIHQNHGKVFLVQRPGYGPANDEEERSFAEINETYPSLPVIHNDGTIEWAARQVLDSLFWKPAA